MSARGVGSGDRHRAEPTQGTMLGTDAAAFDLQRIVAEAPARTVVWSPLSVASALALVWAGATGRTAEELATVLAPGHTPDQLVSAATAACSDSVVGAEQLAANMLWADGRLPVLDSYRDAVLQWPGGAVCQVDFAHDPAAARNALNAAVRESTGGLIPELLDAGDVSADTLAVLVSAFWLRIRWERPFQSARTRPRAFDAPAGTREVPTMQDVRQVPYARVERAGHGWSMISLSAGDVVCDVVLPDRPDDRLTDPSLLSELRSNAASTMVDVMLPRTRVESRAELTAPLQRLGLTRVFGDAAELSGIAPVPLELDRVVHQAVLGIDETGAEAAAATAASMVLAAAGPRPQPVRFHVRHPFAVLLRHRPTGVCYVSAQVTEP